MTTLAFFITSLIVLVLCGFSRRFGGGLLQQWVGPIGGSQVGRAAQAAMVGASVFLLGAGLPSTAAASALTFLGAQAGFPSGMVPKTLKDVGGLLEHGWCAVGPLALGAAAAGLPYGFLLGAVVARPLCYYGATLWQPYVPVLGLNPDKLPDPPAFAEFGVGLAMGIAFIGMAAVEGTTPVLTPLILDLVG